MTRLRLVLMVFVLALMATACASEPEVISERVEIVVTQLVEKVIEVEGEVQVVTQIVTEIEEVEVAVTREAQVEGGDSAEQSRTTNSQRGGVRLIIKNADMELTVPTRTTLLQLSQAFYRAKVVTSSVKTFTVARTDSAMRPFRSVFPLNSSKQPCPHFVNLALWREKRLRVWM